MVFELEQLQEAACTISRTSVKLSTVDCSHYGVHHCCQVHLQLGNNRNALEDSQAALRRDSTATKVLLSSCYWNAAQITSLQNLASRPACHPDRMPYRQTTVGRGQHCG